MKLTLNLRALRAERRNRIQENVKQENVKQENFSECQKMQIQQILPEPPQRSVPGPSTLGSTKSPVRQDHSQSDFTRL